MSIVATDTSIYVADWALSGANTGGIFELIDDGAGGLTLDPLALTGDIFTDPSSILLDQVTSDLVVRGTNASGDGALFRVDVSTGTSTEIANGLDTGVRWNSVALNSDSTDLYFSSGSQLYHFSSVPEPGSAIAVLLATFGLAIRRNRRPILA